MCYFPSPPFFFKFYYTCFSRSFIFACYLVYFPQFDSSLRPKSSPHVPKGFFMQVTLLYLPLTIHFHFTRNTKTGTAKCADFPLCPFLLSLLFTALSKNKKTNQQKNNPTKKTTQFSHLFNYRSVFFVFY